MSFTIRIEPEALADIQDAVDWYELKQNGIGEKFYLYLEDVIQKLESNPYFQISYSNIRCLPLKKYPFMIHFAIDEENAIVIIKAVFNTSMNPVIWENRG